MKNQILSFILVCSSLLTACQKSNTDMVTAASMQKSVDVEACQNTPSALEIPKSIYMGVPTTFSWNRAQVVWQIIDPITQEDSFYEGTPLTVVFSNPGVYSGSVTGYNCLRKEVREIHFEVLADPPPTTTTTLPPPPTTTTTTSTSTTTTLPPPTTTTTTTSTTTTTVPPTTTTTTTTSTTTTTVPPTTTTTTTTSTTTTTAPPTTTTTTTTLPPAPTTTTTTSTTTTTLPHPNGPPTFEAAKPFTLVVQSGYGYPWQTDSGGCVRSSWNDPTYTVYPVCENQSTLFAISKQYSVLFWDINQTALSSLNATILNDWIYVADQNRKPLKFAVAGAIASDYGMTKHYQIMGQRILSTLQKLAQQTTRPSVAKVQVFMRGSLQFTCSVNLAGNLNDAKTCLSQTRKYPRDYNNRKFFVDQVTINW